MGSLISQSPTLLLSSSTYLTAQLILPNLLSSTISPTKTLTTRDHHLLSNKVIGAFHSILSGGLALYLVTLPKWTEQDLIDTKSEIGDGIVALELGYLVSGEYGLMLIHSFRRDYQESGEASRPRDGARRENGAGVPREGGMGEGREGLVMSWRMATGYVEADENDQIR